MEWLQENFHLEAPLYHSREWGTAKLHFQNRIGNLLFQHFKIEVKTSSTAKEKACKESEKEGLAVTGESTISVVMPAELCRQDRLKGGGGGQG